MERVADYIINALHGKGVGHIFMVTGRGALYLTDAVARHNKVKGICTHHEQSAGFASIAYAEANNKIGACLVSTGCAATNLTTSLLNAWQDNIPCIFISGQHKLKETSRYTNIALRTWGSQETDIIPIVSPLTKYATMITDPKDIVYEIDKALFWANNGRKGPVWIDIPVDIQNMRIEPAELKRFAPEQSTNNNPSKEDLRYVVDVLQASKRPVLLIGSGVRSADATLDLKFFLAKYPIPVTFANSSVDVIESDSPLSMGVVASIGGTRCGNFTLQNSDFLLVLGNRLSPQVTGSEYKNFARAAKIVVVDIDPTEHSKNTVRIDRLIVADLKEFLISLVKEDIKGANQDWLDKCFHWKKIFPKCEKQYKSSEAIDLHYLAHCMSDTLKEDSVLLCDAGLEELIIPATTSFKQGQRCIHPASQGSMGFALPGSIGAYYGCQGSIVAVIGDGSIMMNIQELLTISYHKLPIKILVINNNMYSIIRSRQVQQFRSRTIGTNPNDGVGCPNFRKIADAFDITYMKIEGSKHLKRKLAVVFEMEGPVVCEVLCEAEQKYLHNSIARNKRKRIVKRPLEDQSPYMDRELFLSEMIIDPINQ